MKKISIPLKTVIACILFLAVAIKQNASGQTGYIYVHAKALSQDLNQAFNFSISGGSTSVPGFTLEDQALNIEPTDIGGGHGTGGGELWAVTGATNGVNGAIYHRAPGSAIWSVVSGQTASSIDGADLGHCVMVNTSGDAYVYNGVVFIKIFNHSTMGSNAVDIANNGSIASATGITAVVDNKGKVWKYTGDYVTTATWANITPTDNSGGSFKRLDINPTTNDIVLIDGSGYVTKINSSGTGLAYYGRSGAGTWLVMDVAVDNNGNVYAISNNSVVDIVYKYNGASWAVEGEMQQHYFLTCGDASQVWCAKGYPAAQYTWMSNQSSIFTRTDDGTATWLDDERVVTSQNGNAILIPVAAGTYTITEANISSWNLQSITIYDSASGSVTNVAGNSTTIVVKAGQVANAVFTNGIVSPTAISNTCGVTNIIQNFGAGATSGIDGAPLAGLTDYHYFDSANLVPNDGYYSVSQTSTGWTNSILKDHSGLTNGYFLVVNASYATNQFYKHRITGLTPGSVYTLTFWAANLSTTTPLHPNILAGITDTATGIVLGSTSTGNLPTDSAWHLYSFTFTAAVTTGDIFLQNNAPGGQGNDLAIDDIGFNMACAALPVTLTNFSAQKQDTKAMLSWSVTNASNFSHFEIERSTDDKSWTEIGMAMAEESSKSEQDYTFPDQSPLNGINYYRLKMVDINGNSTYSEIRTLDFSNSQWSLSMYPNPVCSGGTVKIQSNESLQMVRMFDINGKLVLAENIASAGTALNLSYTINTSTLSQGMYLIQISNVNGLTSSLKMIRKN